MPAGCRGVATYRRPLTSRCCSSLSHGGVFLRTKTSLFPNLLVDAESCVMSHLYHVRDRKRICNFACIKHMMRGSWLLYCRTLQWAMLGAAQISQPRGLFSAMPASWQAMAPLEPWVLSLVKLRAHICLQGLPFCQKNCSLTVK